MIVTPDVIGTIVAVFSAAVAFSGAVAGLIAHQSKRLDARFDRVEAEVAAVRTELVEVKIAVARLEGPTPRLVRATH